MDALNAITNRVSPRKLGGPAPTPEHLEAMLKAAVAAPDHGRLKPWRFVVIEAASREMFGGLLATSLQRREPKATEAQLEAERKKALRAPLILAVAATVREHPKIPQIEQVMAVAAAMQNLIIAAHALGYGALWRTGAPAYDPVLKRELGLSETDTIVGFLHLGTIEAAGPARNADAASVAHWRGCL
jgi:nitroreductase